MFFAKKAKGFCVEFGEQSLLLARLSQAAAPTVVEELKELPANDHEALSSYLKTAEGKGPTGYAHATCGVYPSRRVVRRHTLELKRVKEPAYFNEVYSQQFRIEPEKFTMQVLNSNDGGEYDTAKASTKEVIFCGMPADEIATTQDTLLATGVYPERLELGSVATLGALVNYLKFKQTKTPLLLLEMSAETTQSFILSSEGVDISRPIASGIAAMIPVVQKELGLKDEESARKLFYSNTFDFTSMGGTLIKKLLKELQSSIGFYEVQTGQSIGSVLCTQLPSNLSWLSGTMAGALGVGTFKLELVPWLESLGITLAEGVTLSPPDDRWLGLFALLTSYNNASLSTATDQKK
jgi:Tfp pilus assembly PilM family ATPase